MKVLKNVMTSALLALAAIVVQSVDVEAAVDNCNTAYYGCQSMPGCSNESCMTVYEDTGSCREGKIAFWWECKWQGTYYGSGWCYFPPPVSC